MLSRQFGNRLLDQTKGVRAPSSSLTDCFAVHLQVRPGLMREQRSVVHIKKCRYLENSGCVGMCVNMCKVGWFDLCLMEAILVVRDVSSVPARHAAPASMWARGRQAGAKIEAYAVALTL